MTYYEGEIKAVLVASGTQINTGATSTLSTQPEVDVGRLAKVIFAVKATSSVAATGSLTITYYEKIEQFIVSGSKTVSVIITGSTIAYTGATAVTSDFSTVKIASVKNDTTQNLDTYAVYITGMVK